ncbi:class I SAM-dependent methyltransferase [Natranaerobius thermophilus]|uniref:Methyltransferase domain-containing protein n=1 Tax=Natranaerobius thermophilus (strain ATCC BAA-1301 / DSM 18059 / JW/NM-WN-LF) TaxID=457570 RepID=B2A6Q4_NATTJ|nr:class I SAM-dependent methyltransferase [Natranaerobius thermophilus]ACB84187.1 hypothetical protein Nther_0592 [Natranaerobius thermophilus JW/NM-WN-LF]
MRADQAYREAIRYYGGHQYISKLRGKYDNVRLFWEDYTTGYYLKPYLRRMVSEKQELGQGLRVCELGCGAGDGYDFLTRLSRERVLDQADTKVISNQDLAFYKGVDLNNDLITEANNRFQDHSKVKFTQGDISQGLPVESGEFPYDLYFTAYATLSHCNDQELEKLFSDIAVHGRNGSIIVGDWLGRYSYEWQSLWTQHPENKPFVSYKLNFYSDQAKNVSTFPMRVMTPEEITEIVDRVSERTGIKLKIKKIFDRSLFVGRHIETGDYNDYPQPLRSMVNSLHEPGHRTYLPNLLVDYITRPGYTWQNNRLKDLEKSWNSLIRYTIKLLQAIADRNKQQPGDDIIGENIQLPDPPDTNSSALRQAYQVIRRTIENSYYFYGDVRADIIENQLGCCLRNLEMKYQQGEGLGHSIVSIIQVIK